jgi:phosphotransferase system enzyme I (PtsP)
MTSAQTIPDSSLLLTLEEISRLVSHSHDPGETLANIVRLIQDRFDTDVCSVYLLEAERSELVLSATTGLNPASVGRVRMRLDEGLTGLVAERLEPVMVDDAFSHPRFRYFPETGEDPYHSFLGVPLLERGVLQGVLVVQTAEPRAFSSSETRMLITVASQLAPLVSGAQLLVRMVSVAHEAPSGVATDGQPPAHSLQGIPLSPGMGQGEAYLVDGFEHRPEVLAHHKADPAHEGKRLASAIEGARAEITRLSQRISALVGEDHGAILQAQLMMLEDRTIDQDLHACLSLGRTAEDALVLTLEKYVAAFQKLATPFFQERIFDVKDVFRRILWHLRPHAGADRAGAGKLVLVAHEASVMDLFSVDLDRLAGVVVERGGPQSHAAILARSLGVPMIGQVADLVSQVKPGQQLFVDGRAAVLLVDPPPEEVADAPIRILEDCPPLLVPHSPETEPRTRPRMEANINLLCEVPHAVEQGARGVGLFRSEFLFLARRTLPTEDEQVGIYRKLLEMLAGRPATIRTFDLRPDKLTHCSHLTSAASGPLDWRQVLVSPPLQKLFKEQVRAILRAGTSGAARILVPLVTTTEQLDFIVRTLEEARAELDMEELEYAADTPLGAMIEVAAAAVMVKTWARRVDFFALGTNDLAASALGIDRDDSFAAATLDPLHPGLLRLIQDVVGAAHHHGRRVTVCGEMAGTAEGAMALAALEVDSLSVAVNQLAAVREVLSRKESRNLPALAPRMRRVQTAEDVRALLKIRAIPAHHWVP